MLEKEVVGDANQPPERDSTLHTAQWQRSAAIERSARHHLHGIRRPVDGLHVVGAQLDGAGVEGPHHQLKEALWWGVGGV